jgi:hypothetical protein
MECEQVVFPSPHPHPTSSFQNILDFYCIWMSSLHPMTNLDLSMSFQNEYIVMSAKHMQTLIRVKAKYLGNTGIFGGQGGEGPLLSTEEHLEGRGFQRKRRLL